MHAVGIVAAAGSGLRLGADLPKALVPAGRPPAGLLGRRRRCAPAGSPRSSSPSRPPSAPRSPRSSPADVVLVDGGATRTASVRAGLAAAGAAADVVLVHDAARPLTPPDVVARVLAALADGARAVVPVLPVVDTTVVVDADGVVTGAARRGRSCAACRRRRASTGPRWSPPTPRSRHGAELTDDAAVVRAAGVPVATVAGDERAAKVTVAHDLGSCAGSCSVTSASR